MYYKFPLIQTFDDVKHALDEKYFRVVERDGHVVINYNHAAPDVFPSEFVDPDLTAIRREFRGITFDRAGNIIRRPFHKFFNVGERDEVRLENINVSQNHYIYDKLDGSMVAPYIVGIDLIWGSKAGDTFIHNQVAEFVKDKPNYVKFAKNVIENGYTPIFEWCSRKKRIILDYHEDQLILTAIRNIYTGEYHNYNEQTLLAYKHDIPFCSIVAMEQFSKDLLQKTKNMTDAEGFVVRFDNGHMVKIKSEWYCNLHRIKSEISNERGVVKLILNDEIDDLRPLMAKDDLCELDEYINFFWTSFDSAVCKIQNIINEINEKDLTRKDFAINHLPDLQPYEKYIVFKLWDTKDNVEYNDVADWLKKCTLAECDKNSKFDQFREYELFSNIPKWKGVYVDE